jgi:hypothetical protein
VFSLLNLTLVTVLRIAVVESQQHKTNAISIITITETVKIMVKRMSTVKRVNPNKTKITPEVVLLNED